MNVMFFRRNKIQLFMRIIPKVLLIYIALLLVGCGSYKSKYLNEATKDLELTVHDSLVEKRLYLIGDAGIGAENNEALLAFKKQVENRDTKDDWLVFLGDNIYPKGLPGKDEKGRESALEQLQAQTDVKSFFKGNILFIPGNHDWYSGVKGLKHPRGILL